MTNETEGSEKRISRRDVIRKGAIVGGLVWAAPVVQSLTRPAFAQTGSPGITHVCCLCTQRRTNDIPRSQCFANSFPPDAETCASLCDDLGYNASSWQSGPAAFNCNAGTGDCSVASA